MTNSFDAVQTLGQIFAAGSGVIKPATYQFCLDSAPSAPSAEVRFSVPADGSPIRVERQYSTDFNVRISLSQEDLAKCIDGSCGLADLYSGKRVKFEGDVSLVASLLQAFELWRQPEQVNGKSHDTDRTYLFKKPMGGQSVAPEALANSTLLQKWVNPYYLQPHVMEAKREAVRAMPLARYAVLDNFFQSSAFADLIAHHQQLDFVPDDVGLNFDSSVVFAEENQHFGSDLFFSPDWHQYISYIVGADLQSPGRALVRLRRHDPDAHGFWPHSDWVNDERGRRAAFVLAYFNKNWGFEDGGIFQLWHPLPANHETETEALHRWNDYTGKRLSFLETEKDIFVEVPVGSWGFKKQKLLLIDQILPEYNRIMICDLTSDPVLHSVSPSNGRRREGFVQWVY